MICLAALRQRGINLRTLLRARDHVTNLTTCSFIISRDNSTLLSSPISRSHDTTTTAAAIPALIASHCLSTASTAGKLKPQPKKGKKKTKKKDVIVLYEEQKNKCPLYQAFFTCVPLAVYVSGVGPYLVSLAETAFPDQGIGYMFNIAAPTAVVVALYAIVIMWGVRFPQKMELTKEMVLKFHIIKWPGYRSSVTVDPRGMWVHRECKKVYSIAKADLWINYTLNIKRGTIERRDILDKLFGKFDPKKHKKLMQQVKEL